MTKHSPLLSLVILMGVLFLAVTGSILNDTQVTGGGSSSWSKSKPQASMRMMQSHTVASSMTLNDEVNPAKMKVISKQESESLGQDYANQMEISMKKLEQKDYSTGPMLVHEGHLHVVVRAEEVASFDEKLDAIVTKSGYFQDKTRSTNYQHLTAVIRIQSDKFNAVVDEISNAAASVTTLSIQTEDVADQYIDSSARADALEAARDSLRALMAKAHTVEEVLTVQKELNRLTEAAESRRQVANNLKKQSDYSTLHLTVVMRTNETVHEEFWTPFAAAATAVSHLTSVCQNIVDAIVYMAVWFAPLALAVMVCKFAFSKQPSSHSKPPSPPQPPLLPL